MSTGFRGQEQPLLGHGRTDETHRIDVTVLSYVERNVLMGLSRGLSRGQLADTLRLSPRTVGQALTSAKEKLYARSLIEAAVLLRLHDGEEGGRGPTPAPHDRGGRER
jgi:DNA-binding CsgD family transcriptional regulator